MTPTHTIAPTLVRMTMLAAVLLAPLAYATELPELTALKACVMTAIDPAHEPRLSDPQAVLLSCDAEYQAFLAQMPAEERTALDARMISDLEQLIGAS